MLDNWYAQITPFKYKYGDSQDQISNPKDLAHLVYPFKTVLVYPLKTVGMY